MASRISRAVRLRLLRLGLGLALILLMIPILRHTVFADAATSSTEREPVGEKDPEKGPPPPSLAESCGEGPVPVSRVGGAGPTSSQDADRPVIDPDPLDYHGVIDLLAGRSERLRSECDRLASGLPVEGLPIREGTLSLTLAELEARLKSVTAEARLLEDELVYSRIRVRKYLGRWIQNRDALDDLDRRLEQGRLVLAGATEAERQDLESQRGHESRLGERIRADYDAELLRYNLISQRIAVKHQEAEVYRQEIRHRQNMLRLVEDLGQFLDGGGRGPGVPGGRFESVSLSPRSTPAESGAGSPARSSGPEASDPVDMDPGELGREIKGLELRLERMVEADGLDPGELDRLVGLLERSRARKRAEFDELQQRRRCLLQEIGVEASRLVRLREDQARAYRDFTIAADRPVPAGSADLERAHRRSKAEADRVAEAVGRKSEDFLGLSKRIQDCKRCLAIESARLDYWKDLRGFFRMADSRIGSE